MVEIKCNICKQETKLRFVIIDSNFEKADGSDFIVCKTCFNHYANQEFDKLTDRIPGDVLL